jgi:hypothetical protein
MILNRRSLLRGGALLPLCLLIDGCRKYGPACPTDPIWHSPKSPLAIDIHAHVFNATDLQVRDFIARVAGRQAPGGLATLAKYLGGVLRFLSWHAAPTGKDEMRMLRKLSADVESCPAPTVRATLDAQRASQYERAVSELKGTAARMRVERGIPSLERSASWEAASDNEKGIRAIEQLPDRYRTFRDRRALRAGPLELSAERVSLESALAFVIEMFQYRYGSVYRLLQTYNAEEQKLDLIVAHLVDYDWWLSGGKATPTSLREQIDVMTSIAVLTGGRVHPFVPFCPFREAQYRRQPTSTFSSLELVQQAILSKGAIGVKLYPPMGFAPLGNAGQSPDLWKSASWLPALAHEPGFGERLDAALRDLYAWCVKEDVPVMAHTNASNGPSDAFEALAGPDYWKLALQAYPRLRVSFGHFGSVTNRSGGSAGAGAFLELLAPAADAPGSRAFADAAYFSEALERPQELEDALVTLFESDNRARQTLISRLMFGTDWKMLVLENDADRYLKGMSTIMGRVATRLAPLGDYSRLASNFSGANAAAFLGLKAGNVNRRRINDFYDRMNVGKGAWESKVDAM